MRERTPLATRLDAYSASAAAMQSSRAAGTERHWLAYAAAATAALTMVPAAEAAPIYSGLRNVTLDLGGAAGALSTGIDIDADGHPDFFLFLGRSFTANHGTFQAALSAASSNAILVNNVTYGSVRRLAAGALVSAGAGPFSHAALNIIHGVVTTNGAVGQRYGNWCGAASGAHQCSNPGFAGVRFAQGAADHFGWIRLHVTNDGERPTAVTALDWAYESQAGAPIVTAVPVTPVPEPGTLALLAGGAAALLASRRRRQGTPPAAPAAAGESE